MIGEERMKEYLVKLIVSMTVLVDEDEGEDIIDVVGEELKNAESINSWDVLDTQERNDEKWW